MKRAILTLTALMFSTTSLTAFGSQQSEQASSETGFVVDMDRLVTEIQQGIRGEGYFGLVWWLPEEFLAFHYGAEQAELASNYTIFIMMVAKLGSLSGMTFVPRSELHSNIILRDSNGIEYGPLETLPPEIQGLPTLFKVILGQLSGPLGENIEFFIFPGKNKEGEVLADAKLKGSFSMVIKEVAGPGESVYEWNLPLTSVLPPTFCSVGGEQVEANWNYCPWHGNPLN